MNNVDKAKFSEFIKPCLKSKEIASKYFFLTKADNWEALILLSKALDGYKIIKLATRFANIIEGITQSVPTPKQDLKFITEESLKKYCRINKINRETVLKMCYLLQAIWEDSFLLPESPDRINKLANKSTD